MTKLSQSRTAILALSVVAGAVGAMIVSCTTSASADTLPIESASVLPDVANLTVSGATCTLPYMEVSGVTRDTDLVTVLYQREDGTYAVLDGESVYVSLNGEQVQTYKAENIQTEPGSQFVVRAMAAVHGRYTYRLIINRVNNDGSISSIDDVQFASDTTGCAEIITL